MPVERDFQDPEFLEAAAEDLRKEAERIKAYAQRMRENPGPPEFGIRIACSNTCGQCCFCSVC